MAYWLMKSEPYVFSWQQLVKKGRSGWDGVRNHTAKRNLMDMAIGDEAFFYHSNEGMEIVGVMKVVKTAYPDPSDETGRFVQVDVAPVAPMPLPVTLKAVKAQPALADMALVRLSRLSVQPVTPAEWKLVCKIGSYKPV